MCEREKGRERERERERKREVRGDLHGEAGGLEDATDTSTTIPSHDPIEAPPCDSESKTEDSAGGGEPAEGDTVVGAQAAGEGGEIVTIATSVTTSPTLSPPPLTAEEANLSPDERAAERYEQQAKAEAAKAEAQAQKAAVAEAKADAKAAAAEAKLQQQKAKKEAAEAAAAEKAAAKAAKEAEAKAAEAEAERQKLEEECADLLEAIHRVRWEMRGLGVDFKNQLQAYKDLNCEEVLNGTTELPQWMDAMIPIFERMSKEMEDAENADPVAWELEDEDGDNTDAGDEFETMATANQQTMTSVKPATQWGDETDTAARRPSALMEPEQQLDKQPSALESIDETAMGE